VGNSFFGVAGILLETTAFIISVVFFIPKSVIIRPICFLVKKGLFVLRFSFSISIPSLIASKKKSVNVPILGSSVFPKLSKHLIDPYFS